jgi:hypothetical protein
MRRSSIVAALCVLGAACGSSSSNGNNNTSGLGGSPYCDSLGAFATAWSGKVGSCASGTVTNPSTGSACATSCATATANCTSADKTVMDAYTACLNNASTCTSSTETTWFTSLGTCMEHAGSLSSACESSCSSTSGGTDGGGGGTTTGTCQLQLSGALTGSFPCTTRAYSQGTGSSFTYSLSLEVTSNTSDIIAAILTLNSPVQIGTTYTLASSSAQLAQVSASDASNNEWIAGSESGSSATGSMNLVVSSQDTVGTVNGVTSYKPHGTLNATLVPLLGSGSNVTLSATF